MAQGSLTAAGSGEEVVPASGVAEPGSRASSAAGQEDPGGRDSQGGSGTRHRLKKTAAAAAVAAEGRYATKTVAEVIGASRSNLVERLQQRPPRRRIGRPPLPDEELVAQIKARKARGVRLGLVIISSLFLLIGKAKSITAGRSACDKKLPVRKSAL